MDVVFKTSQPYHSDQFFQLFCFLYKSLKLYKILLLMFWT